MDQVSQFEEYLAPKPYGAQWDSSNSLFAIWIGINDVVRHDPACWHQKQQRDHKLNAGQLIRLGKPSQRLSRAYANRRTACADVQTNVTSQPAFHTILMDRLFSQVGTTSLAPSGWLPE